ncbi:hypothetical protein MGAST_27875 [Mycobacterium gastri 'Wayne']|uniref:Uncharacterized protein n=1 Tax=Mycobacterium gastri TaxID=1777 RepID=A0A1X1VK78_MYCGS|nr:hypothetical protein MGAST_27875 [Mycobacterium gastri 'Wayne']ORV69436.1 hypothetical protein AWC07_00490 [Mycobacterium gastri]
MVRLGIVRWTPRYPEDELLGEAVGEGRLDFSARFTILVNSRARLSAILPRAAGRTTFATTPSPRWSATIATT